MSPFKSIQTQYTQKSGRPKRPPATDYPTSSQTTARGITRSLPTLLKHTLSQDQQTHAPMAHSNTPQRHNNTTRFSFPFPVFSFYQGQQRTHQPKTQTTQAFKYSHITIRTVFRPVPYPATQDPFTPESLQK